MFGMLKKSKPKPALKSEAECKLALREAIEKTIGASPFGENHYLHYAIEILRGLADRYERSTLYVPNRRLDYYDPNPRPAPPKPKGHTDLVAMIRGF